MFLPPQDFDTASVYIKELRAIQDMPFSHLRYSRLIDLSNKWADDKDIKAKLTDGFCSYVSDIFISMLEEYEPVPFSKKLKTFISNIRSIKQR